MRYLLIVFTLLFSITSLAQESVEEATTKAVKAFLYGASINSPKAHDRFWAEELTYTSSSGNRFGKEHLMSGMKEAKAKDPEEVKVWYGAEDIDVKQFGDTVVFNFTLTAEEEGKVTKYYYNTGVLIERDGRWQAVNWNATEIPK
ncbi:nuclear transport factor 2 family protein [Idiomarina sp. PL1-037]|uniref:nuclear transport factor 2 family protein n=1 Tax=Idiomarina sp. PL1-037 TaxID=3095365 RepID=UPI002ACC2E16|nr:nuclear transport factor 2 family protein [Idiomarina sp. PL1-037]WQC52818.1 nuclear transport factor 2 family protein [Idiomarina sp. PL1-037]